MQWTTTHHTAATLTALTCSTCFLIATQTSSAASQRGDQGCSPDNSIPVALIDSATVADCLSTANTIAVPDGRTFAVPAAGMSVEAEALVVSGAPEVAEVVVARTPAGETAAQVGETFYGSDAAVANLKRVTNTPITSNAAITKCQNASYALSKSNFRWTNSYTWRYNPKNQPTPAALSAIQRGAGTWAGRVSVCGSTVTNSLRQVYAGTTQIEPGVLANGSCGSHDGVNTIGWGPIRAASGGVLAATCTWRVGAVPFSSDQKYNTLYAWSASTTCAVGRYDIQGVAAHEFGHTFGLGHVAVGTEQTMKPSARTCDVQMRSLGRGDAAGIKALYR